MRWNTIYYIYEMVAILMIAACWGVMAFIGSPEYDSQFADIRPVMERGLALAKTQIENADSILVSDVRRYGNSADGLDRAGRAKLLQKKTSLLIDQLEQTKNKLEGVIDEDKKWVCYLMLETKQATMLKNATAQHIKWLQTEFYDLDIAMKTWSQDNKTNKDFTSAHFNNSKPVAVITMLAQKQLKLRHYEATIMRKLGVRELECKWWSHIYDPLVVAPLKYIQAGEEYVADLFVGKSASGSSRMTVNNVPVAVKDGVAEIEIKPKGSGLKHWQGTILYQNKNKKDSKAYFNLSYWVK